MFQEFTREMLSVMTEDELRTLDALLLADAPIWVPLDGPQEDAFFNNADVVGYGGAAGGGKTDLGCGLALTQHQKVAIFRLNGTELTGIVDRMTEILGGERKGYNGKEMIWRYTRKDGKKVQIEFGSFPNPNDHMKYQGRPHDLLIFDEAANMREAQVRFLIGWLRSRDPHQRKRVLMTFNPPTTVEGRWIIGFFSPWLNKKHPKPAKPGEIRYFATIDGRDVEIENNDPRPFVLMSDEYGEQERIYDFDPKKYSAEEVIRPMSRTFLPAKVSDNPYLSKSGYVSVLQSLPEPLRSQMLHGDFTAGIEDDAWQVIPTAWVEQAMERWRPKDVKPTMDSLGVDVAMGGKDNTVISRRHENWYDKLIKHKGRECKDGSQVAGFVVAQKRDGAPIHLDLFGVGGQVYGPLMALHQQTVGVNVGDPSAATDQTQHFKLFNLRSELVWRMREELDPASNNGIALPDDPELLQELCAYTWELVGNKIKVCSREDIIDAIGRSPDKATAVILARMETPKLSSFEKNSPEDYDPLDAVRRGTW